MTKWGLVQGYKAGSTVKTEINLTPYINRLQTNKHRILSIDYEKKYLTKFNPHSQ